MSLIVGSQGLSFLTEPSQCSPETNILQQEGQKIFSCQRNNPLDLPEILLIIADFLDRRSQFTCLSVSRTWHQTFLTWIWPSLHIDTESHRCPPLPVLQLHATLIYSLSVGNDTCRSSGNFFCPYLSSLTITQAQKPSLEALAFIRRHQQSLTFLSIDTFTTDELFEVIADCQNLEELQLHNIRLTHPDQWRIFQGTLWPRLRKITIEGSWLIHKESEEGLALTSSGIITDIATGDEKRPVQVVEALEALTTSKIQELVINTSGSTSFEMMQNQLQLIRQCPDLTRLVWYVKKWETYSGPLYLLAETIRSGHRWKQLESLHIPWQRFLFEDFLAVMGGIDRLTELNIRGSWVEPETWSRMKDLTPHHWHTIRVLNLMGCLLMWRAGWVIQEIMCSMPNLTIFHNAVALTENDISHDDRPWVCLGLTDFTFAPSLLNPKSQAKFMDRIVSLVRLERLVCVSPGGGHRGQSVRLTLNKGLDLLKSLKLREFGHWSTYSTDVWGKPEAQWVLKNWPDLKTLIGVKLNTRAKHLLRHLITS